MFPHPQNLIAIRSMERERLLAQVARERRHQQHPLRPTPPFSLRRAAKMIMSLLP